MVFMRLFPLVSLATGLLDASRPRRVAGAAKMVVVEPSFASPVNVAFPVEMLTGARQQFTFVRLAPPRGNFYARNSIEP
jgi:hypothetical protein